MENWPKLPPMPMEISLIPSYNIDADKWNRCVDTSPNGLIYATSAFLGHLTDNWTGVVLNDYDAVMPIAWRKKFGVVYTYNVPFIQQLGVVHESEKPDLQPFVDALNRLCRYGTYAFNFANDIQDGVSCTNFVLDLNMPYERLWPSFSEDARQQTRADLCSGLQYQHGEFEEAIDLCRDLYGKKSGVETSHFNKLKLLCSELQKEGKLEVRRASTLKGDTLAIALMPKDNRRLYNIINSTVAHGKKSRANYFLLLNIWKEFCESGLLYDFEGSDIAGVRDFYKKFRPRNEPFKTVHINRLPGVLKMLKK